MSIKGECTDNSYIGKIAEKWCRASGLEPSETSYEMEFYKPDGHGLTIPNPNLPEARDGRSYVYNVEFTLVGNELGDKVPPPDRRFVADSVSIYPVDNEFVAMTFSGWIYMSQSLLKHIDADEMARFANR